MTDVSALFACKIYKHVFFFLDMCSENWAVKRFMSHLEEGVDNLGLLQALLKI